MQIKCKWIYGCPDSCVWLCAFASTNESVYWYPSACGIWCANRRPKWYSNTYANEVQIHAQMVLQMEYYLNGCAYGMTNGCQMDVQMLISKIISLLITQQRKLEN